MIAAAPTPTWYLILAAVLFAIGAVGVLTRRTPLVIFMCIELMLNAVNLSFVALAARFGNIDGQTAVFFVMVVAAAEVVVGLGIVISIRDGQLTIIRLELLVHDQEAADLRGRDLRLRGEVGIYFLDAILY